MIYYDKLKVNFIRIKNPQLNKVLNNYNEKNNTKEKKSNCFLPIRNYNSLHKNNNQMNRSLNYSMNKRNTNHENLEHKRRCNNSLKNKDNTHQEETTTTTTTTTTTVTSTGGKGGFKYASKRRVQQSETKPEEPKAEVQQTTEVKTTKSRFRYTKGK